MDSLFRSPVKYFFSYFFIFQSKVIGYSDDKLIHTAIAAAIACLAQLTCPYHKIMFVLTQLFCEYNLWPLPFRKSCVRNWLNLVLGGDYFEKCFDVLRRKPI